MDHKIIVFGDDLHCFNMSIKGISKSKCFVYEVGSFVTVYSGRSLPTGKVSVLRRNEWGWYCDEFCCGCSLERFWKMLFYF